MATAKTKRLLAAGQRARILVVDDSLVMRQLIIKALQGESCLEVVGTAQNGREAVEKVAALAPDAVTMDIEMPEMDGLKALQKIRQCSPQVRVVMLSCMTEHGSSATFEALALGADAYVTKQKGSKPGEDSTANLRAELAPKIKQFFVFTGTDESRPSKSAPEAEPVKVPPAVDLARHRKGPPTSPNFNPRILVIGISTGGPAALARIVPDIPADFPLPILIVQHMPAPFTRTLAERLQESSPLCVREAQNGETINPGCILIAPGDYHMRVRLVSGEKRPRIALDQGQPENSCRPAVDALFESVASIYGGSTIAAVLTGMGRDGLRGARLLNSAGAMILAQDENTSTVWGMPRAVTDANLAHAVLPLEMIVPHILKSIQSHTIAIQFQPRGVR